jgi:hypothetical protein
LDPYDTRYVISHLIPASLGGTNDPKNLFPQTVWFANLKHRLDLFFEKQVQDQQITPRQAHGELTSNWIQAVHAHYIRDYGLTDPNESRKKEDALHW